MASELSPDQQIWLSEYQEAGQVTRSQAGLVRNGLGLFATVQTAVIGVIVARGLRDSIAIPLEAVGLVVSAFTFQVTKRLYRRYSDYMQRARCLERRLGMNLYQFSHDRETQHPTRPAWATNTRLFTWMPALAFFAFVALLVVSAWTPVREALCG